MNTRAPTERRKRVTALWSSAAPELYNPHRVRPWLSAMALCLSVGCVKGRCYQSLDCPAPQICGASGVCVSRDASSTPDAPSPSDASTTPEASAVLDAMTTVDARASETSEGAIGNAP